MLLLILFESIRAYMCTTCSRNYGTQKKWSCCTCVKYKSYKIVSYMDLWFNSLLVSYPETEFKNKYRVLSNILSNRVIS